MSWLGIVRGVVGGLIAVSALATGVRAEAAEVKVLSAGAVRAIITELAEAFTRETGHTVAFSFGIAGVTRGKLEAGEPAAVVILTDVAIDQMASQGLVARGTRTDIGRTAIGVGVREGAAKPDIATAEAFKQAVLAAQSITYVDPAQGATSGIHLAGVLQRLGIADAVKGKTTLVPGGYPAELVARGEVEVVVHQISEILPVKGVTLVGQLPRDLQKFTVYSAGMAAKSAQPELARAFMEYVTRPAAKARLAQAGLDYKE